MEMLRRGIVPPPNMREMRRAMKHGWNPGAAQGSPSQYFYDTDFYAQQQLRRGIQVACVGFALVVGLGFIGYRGDGQIYPGPWLLGGLVPLFVGIAQIISAVLSGATFGPPSARQQSSPTQNDANAQQAASGVGGMAPGPTYGGWRPGTVPEIEKPASPPDYRS